MAGNNSNAMKARWKGLSKAERAATVSAAHKARRGSKDKIETLLARAATRYVRGVGIGPHERTFAKMLEKAGIPYRQQVPLGKYNIDFTVSEDLVAVEIRSGSGRAYNFERVHQRRESILEHRHLFEVYFTGTSRKLRPKVIEQLVAFLDFARRNKPAPGQHRMIRPDGDIYLTRRYGGGRPSAITEKQIAAAISLRRNGASRIETFRKSGIPRRRLGAILKQNGL